MDGFFNVMDNALWINFFFFLIALFISNYIPGNLLLHTLKLDKFSKTILSLILGMVLWGYQGYVFGYLHIRFATYIYLLVCFMLWIVKHKNNALPIPSLSTFKENFLLIFLCVIGTLIQLSNIWFNGIWVAQGLYFCCGEDTMYHLALTNELVNHFPPLEPGTVHSVVTNYHYFSNMIASEWVRIFSLPITPVYFQYATIVLSLLLGASIITFGKILILKKGYIYWLLLFFYFSGGGIYLIILLSQHTLDLSSHVLYDATKIWSSPPRIYGIVILLSALSFFHLWLKQRTMLLTLISGLMFGCLISIKVYFGFFILAGFVVLNSYFLGKKDIQGILPSLLTLFFSLLLYLPINNQAGGLFFSGMWRFENFIVFSPLGLSHLELARVVYAQHHNILRVIQYELFFVLVYIVASFGTLLTALIQIPLSIRLLRIELHYLLLGGIVASLIAGSFFLQQTGGANSVQFIMTAVIVTSLYAGLALGALVHTIKNVTIRIGITILLIVFTIPYALYTSYTNIYNLTHLSGLTITHKEIEALNFLKKSPPGVILTPLSNCLYIRLLTQKTIYACDDAHVLSDHNIQEGKQRLDIAHNLFTHLHLATSSALLQREGITYIYIRNTSLEKPSPDSLRKIFTNDEITILRVPSR